MHRVVNMKTLRMPNTLAPLLALMLFMPTDSSGGDTLAHSGLLHGFRVATGFRSWSIRPDSGKVQTISQFYLPLSATVRIGPRSSLVLSSEGAWGNYTLNGSPSGSLNGTSDVRAQFVHERASRHVLLLAGINVPTGKANLSPEELNVARVLGHPLLGFHLKEYGKGLDFNLGAAVTLPVRLRWKVGIGLGYVYHGPYGLVAGDERFYPAQEGTVSTGLDMGGRTLGGGIGSFDSFAIYRFLAKDRVGSRTVLDEGNELAIQAQGDIHWSRLRSFALARLLLKDRNRAIFGEGDQAMTILRRAGTGLLARLGAERPFSRKLHAGVNGEWYRFTGSEVSGRNGNSLGIGPALRFSAGAGTQLDLLLLYLFGEVEGMGGRGNIRLRGHAISLTMLRVPGA